MGAQPINRHEHFFCVDLCNVAYRFAKECLIDARVFVRKDDQTIQSLYQEVNDWAKDSGVSVEVHFNASPEKNADGTETLFYGDNDIEFAREIHDAICSVLGRKNKKNRGLKKLVDGDRGAANLKAKKVPGCLIEPFFGDNPIDANLGHMKSWEIAQAIARATLRYFIQRESENPLLDAT
jgi:N-acetylmuramoyl-L-alanine amidase